MTLASTLESRTDQSPLCRRESDTYPGCACPQGGEWFLWHSQRYRFFSTQEIQLVSLVFISGVFLCLECHQNHTLWLPSSVLKDGWCYKYKVTRWPGGIFQVSLLPKIPWFSLSLYKSQHQFKCKSAGE